MAFLSFGLHAFALHVGALALVQPIVVSGVAFAVPLRAALSRRRPPGAEVAAVVVTAIGLAVFLVASNPGADAAPPQAREIALAFTAAGLVCAAAMYRLAGRCHVVARRAGLYGVTAGVLFGLVAGLIKVCLAGLVTAGVVGLLVSWPIWALIVSGLSGVAVNQRAYRTGALSASMPVLNIVDVLVALSFGLVVFHETPAHSVTAVTAQCLALGCIAFGLRRLGVSDDQASGAGAGEGLASSGRSSL